MTKDVPLIKYANGWSEIRVHANRIDIAERKLMLPGFNPARILIWMKDIIDCYSKNHLFETDDFVIVPRDSRNPPIVLPIPQPLNSGFRAIIAAPIHKG